MNKTDYLALIKSNIDKHRYHMYLISDKQSKFDYIYTIGLSETIGFELIIAGWINVDINSQAAVIRAMADVLLKRYDAGLQTGEPIEIPINKDICLKRDGQADAPSLSVQLNQVDSFWVENLMFGAIDYYKNDDIKALQLRLSNNELLPSILPDMSVPLDNAKPSIWHDYFKQDDFEQDDTEQHNAEQDDAK